MGWISIWASIWLTIPWISALTLSLCVLAWRQDTYWVEVFEVGLLSFSPTLGVLPGYRKWPLQDAYPTLLGVSVRVTAIETLGPPLIPDLLHVPEVHPTIPPNSFLLPCSLYTLLPYIHNLFPFPAPLASTSSLYPTLIFILFLCLREIQASFLQSSLFAFLGSVYCKVIILHFMTNIYL